MGNQTSKPAADSEADLKKFSHFTSGDIREWSTSFKSIRPTDLMHVEDLEKILSALYPRGKVAAFSRNLFHTMNISQTGKVDFNELMIALSILASGSNFERLRWLFRFYDQDKDGIVSRVELIDGLASITDLLCSTPAGNMDASLCADEIFLSLQNESGLLTFDDFEKLSEINWKCFSRLSPLSRS